MNIGGPDDLLRKVQSLQGDKAGLRKDVGPSGVDKPFEQFLTEAFKDVNNLQGQVRDSVEKMLSGEITDVNKVMNMMAEAGVAFDLMLEIRNKVIEAYRQLERMNF